ncbi:MAG TPA: filamentous hemagglutinin N-terminal domain-containing protein [Rhodanobacter sp.]|nr:filamentous hemagglutinin N-terminal domain-containing protein [Rhodanobacter sp.]
MHTVTDATHRHARKPTQPGSTRSASLRRKALPLSLSAALMAGISVSPGALAGGVNPTTSPTGGVVVGGSGSISQQGANTVINQLSNRLALDWHTFNVGKDATVLFKQPSFKAVALNRILDQNPSRIFGHINSNGQVFLINTHGILFGSTAQVNVGGLVASTLDLTPTDFLASHFNLNAHGGVAGVVNHGTIEAASGGSVSLVGGSVANDGLILANYGNINLDGADRAVLDFDGDGLINIQVTGALKKKLDASEPAVSNSGTLDAASGTVVLQASAARNLFTNVVNNSGVISAGGIRTDGGTVRLVAAGGNATSSGMINVSGTHGGSAQVLSDQNVSVTGTIDASGTHGGGSIRVGGGYQGGEGLPTASATYIGPSATLDADAKQAGNGGSVVVWGSQANNFYGGISARGGALSGNGGLVETSSHYGLNAQGTVDASAPHGTAGTWLLDPYDITIDNYGGTSSNITTTSPFKANGNSSQLDVGTLNTALTGGTTVRVFTGSSGGQNGDITVNAPIIGTSSGTGAASLYLEAAGSIFLNSTITAAGSSIPLNAYLWANYGGGAVGSSYSSNASCASSTNCVVNLTGAGITTDGGNLDIQTTGAVTIDNASSIATGTGAITIGNVSSSSPSKINLDSSVSTSGTQAYYAPVLLGASAITLAGTSISLPDGVTGSGDGLTITGNATLGATSALGALSVSGTTLLSGTVNTTGTQTYSQAVTLNGDASLVSSGSSGGITFGGALDSDASSHSLTLNAGSNTVSFGGSVGSLSQLNTLTSSGSGAVNLAGSVTTTGTQSYAGTLDLSSTNTQLSGSSVSLLAGASGSSTNLTIAGNATLAGTSNLATLTASNGSTSSTLSGSITTSGTQTYGATSTTLSGDTLLTGTGVSVTGSLAGGGHGLTINGGATLAAASGLSTLSVSGSSTLNGNITSSGAQTYSGAVALGGNITLDSTGASGGLTLGSTVDNATSTQQTLTADAPNGAVSFGGAVGRGSHGALAGLSVQGGTFSAGALNIGSNNLSVTTTGGAISQTGAFTVIGNSSFNAGANAITLTDSGNNFAGPVSLSNSGANNVALSNNGNALTLGNVGVGSGSLTLSGTGITQVVGSAITQAAGAGTASFNAGTNGTLTLGNSGNGFTGAVNLTGGNTQVASSSALQLGSGTVTGTLTASSDGAMTQSGSGLNVAGAASFTQNDTTAGSGQDITLDNPGNNFASSVTFAAGSGAQINNLSLTNTTTTPGTLTLPSSVTGNLTLDYTTASLTLPVVSVGGALDASAGGSGIAIANSISTGGAQTYNDAVTLGADATLSSTGGGAIDFASTIDGAHALAVNTSGVTTFGGAVGGTTQLTSLTTDASGSTQLDGNVGTTGAQTYNDAVTLGANATLASSNAVTFGGTLDGAHDLTVNANGPVKFVGAVGSSTALSRLATTGGSFSAGALTIGNGGLSVQTTAGDITQGGAFTVSGASSFDAGTNAVTLTNAANAFTGAVSLTSGNASLTNNQATVLGAGTVGGTLAVTSSGALSQTGALSVAGASHFDAGTNALALTDAANAFMGAVSLTSGNASLTNNQATVLGAGTVGGTLAVSSNGALSQTGVLSVTGAASFTQTSTTAGASQDMLLGSQANDFQGAVTFAAGSGSGINNLSLENTDATPGPLTLPASITGNLTLDYTHASLTLPVVSVGGALDASAGGSGITIASSVSTGGAQTYHDAVTLGADATLASTGGGAINFASTIDGAHALTVNTSGLITFGSALGGSMALTGLNATGGVLSIDGDMSAGSIALDSTSDLALSHNLTASTVSLNSGGTITQSAGVIAAGTLTGSAMGDTTLSDANLVGALGAFNTANLSLTNAQALAVNGPLTVSGTLSLTTVAGALTLDTDLAANALALTSASDLALAHNLTASTVALNSGGTITQSAGVIAAGTLTGSSTGDTMLTGANRIGTLGAFNAANFSLTNAQALTVNGPLTVPGTLSLATTSGSLTDNTNLTSNALTLNAASDLALAHNLTGSTVALNSGGTITQSAGVIAAGTLTGNSTGDTMLTGANRIGTLGTFNAANFSLTNAQALAVNGPLTVPGTLSLATTSGSLTVNTNLTSNALTLNSASDLALAHNLTGSTVVLNSGGTIAQSAGTISAATLTGNSTGDTMLTGANRIGTLGTFNAANFSLTNAQALAVNGPLTTTGGTGSIGLTTTSGALNVDKDLSGGAITLSSASDLALATNVTSQSLTLVSGGNIAQNGGVLAANSLSGSSAGSTALGGSNQIATLGAFGSGSGFLLNDARTLVVTGPVTGGSGVVSLGTTAGTLTVNGTLGGTAIDLSGQDGLVINAAASSGAGNTTLASAAGAISEGSNGSVTASSLSGSAAGSVALGGANQVATLGHFTTGGNFSFDNTRTLTVNSPLDVNGGAGDLSLTTTGNASDLILASGLDAANVVLRSGRDIKQTGSGISTTTLSGSSVGDTALTGDNHVATLGVFSAANFSLSDGQSLAVNGPLTTTNNQGNLSVITTSGPLAINAALAGNAVTLGSAGNLVLASLIKGNVVTLGSGKNISQGSASAIFAGTLSGQSAAGTVLDQANQVGTLAGFRAAGLSFTNAGGLNVAGPLDGGTSVSLTTTSGDLSINGAVNGITTALQSAGGINEGGSGTITAATLTGHSGGATSLLGVNHVGTLGSFSASGFDLSNAQSLTVTGPLDGGSSATLTTTAGDLAIDGAVSGTQTTLHSAGAISEGSGGGITAGTLSGSATGITTLGSRTRAMANRIGTLGNFSSTAGFSLTNAQTLTLASVGGSSYSVDAGTAALYLAIAGGDLFEQGQTPLYDGLGTFSATGKIGSASLPIYVIGTGDQSVALVGEPPAYFYAVDRQGNILPLVGDLSVNVPTSLFTSRAQNASHRSDAYIDPSVISANYRSFGIVPSGILLPEDQQQCQPELEDCPDE